MTAGLDLIDEQGLDRFGMRALARRLAVDPMTLYWHVHNRDELLRAIAEKALASPAFPPRELPWADWLREMALAYRQAAHRHPRCAPLFAASLTPAAANLRLAEEVVAVLEEAGFAGADLPDAYNAIVGAVVGWVGVELSTRPSDDPDRFAADTQSALTDISAEQYPRLAANRSRLVDQAFGLRWTSGADRPLDSSFELLVDLLVSALQQRRGAALHRRE